MKRIVTLIFLLSVVNVYGRSRDDVIRDAIIYSTISWNIRLDNLLDVKYCDINADPSKYPDRMVPGGNEKDDRSEYYDVKLQTCVVSLSKWPYYIRSEPYVGEAYAYGSWDSTEVFKSRIESTSERWIAGRRGVGDPLVPEPLPSGSDYDGFTGIDCSGLVSRVIGLENYNNTRSLVNYMIKISTDKARAGDILNKVGTHAIIFNGWIEMDKARIIHSTAWSIKQSTHVRRVIEDEATFKKQDDGKYYLYWRTTSVREEPYDDYHLYEFYSPFPQYNWLTTTNTISVNIRSGTNIKLESILFELKDKDGNIISAGNDNKFVSISTFNFKNVIAKYRVSEDPRVIDGEYQVRVISTNTLELMDESTTTITVQRGPMSIYWSYEPLYITTGEIKGVVTGSNTIETAPYFPTSKINFVLKSTAPINSITIYDRNNEQKYLVNVDTDTFDKNTYIYTTLLKDLEDGLGYRMVAADVLGNATTMYFHLDRDGPDIFIEHAKVNTDFSMDIDIKVVDNVSGLMGENLIRTPADVSLEYNINQSTYPPLLTEDSDRITLSANGSFRATNMNNTGRFGSLQFWASYDSNVRAEIPDRIWGFSNGPGKNIIYWDWNNAGVISTRLREAYISLNRVAGLPEGCYFIDQPEGMSATLIAVQQSNSAVPLIINNIGENKISFMEYPIDRTNELFGRVNLLTFENLESTSTILNITADHLPQIELYVTGNNNIGRYVCSESTEIFTYQQNTLYPDVNAFVRAEVLSVSGLMMKFSQGNITYGTSAYFDKLGVNINNVIKDGNIEISRLPGGGGRIYVDGWKPIEYYIYMIKTTTEYEGPVEIIFYVDLSRYTERQRNEATIYHADENSYPWVFKPLSSVRDINSGGVGTIKTEIARLNSLFTVMVPIDDRLAPETIYKIYGNQINNYIEPDTYIGFEGEDMDDGIGDVTGYKETLYFINPEVSVEECYNIYLANYNPEMPKGSCYNPIYEEAFSLRNEGKYMIYYTGVDNFGNRNDFKLVELYIDTTPSVADMYINNRKIIEDETTMNTTDYIKLSAIDPISNGVGIGVKGVYYGVDVNITVDTTNPEEFYPFLEENFEVYKETFTLAPGTHTVYYITNDKMNNVSKLYEKKITVVGEPLIDTKAPQVVMMVGEKVLENGTTEYIKSTDTIRIIVNDPEYSSGIKWVKYLIDHNPSECEDIEETGEGEAGSCSNPFYRGGFVLNEGEHYIYYMAKDNANNESEIKKNYFIVLSTNETKAPYIELRYPYYDAKGVEKVIIDDTIDIIGKIEDNNLLLWTVEYTTSTNYITISSGAGNIEGNLGRLDTSKIRGRCDIKITAIDGEGNRTILTTDIYIGNPQVIKTIGKGADIKLNLKHPYDIIITTNNYIWISDSGNDRVIKIDEEGNIVVNIDGKGKDKLSKPQGIAIDGNGNVYICDTNNHRIVIYNSTGGYIGEIINDNKKNFTPTDIAVDNGGIYIADYIGKKIFKYDYNNKQLLKIIDLKDINDDTDFCNELEEKEYKAYCKDNLKPFNITLENSKIIISAINRGVIVVIDEEGNIIDGVGKGVFKKPAGVYLSKHYGYIADMKARDIMRIDKETALFDEIVSFNKKEKVIPISLAMDNEYNIWVVDWLGSKIMKYTIEVDSLTTKGYSTFKTEQINKFSIQILNNMEAFNLKETYCFPNPAKGKNPTIHIDSGKADRINIKVYDITGRLVDEIEINEEPQLINDGQGLEYAYEKEWDVRNYGSGVYIMKVQTGKQTKTFKCAIIK